MSKTYNELDYVKRLIREGYRDVTLNIEYGIDQEKIRELRDAGLSDDTLKKLGELTERIFRNSVQSLENVRFDRTSDLEVFLENLGREGETRVVYFLNDPQGNIITDIQFFVLGRNTEEFKCLTELTKSFGLDVWRYLI